MDRRDGKLLPGLAAAAALLIAMSVARPAVLHAQEDESSTVTPLGADDATDGTWEPVASSADDTAAGQVLELPQVVAADHNDVAAAPADSSEPDSAPAADQPSDVADYAEQDAAAGAAPNAMAPMRMRAAPFVPYRIIGANWPAPGWSRYIVAAPAPFAPIASTNPMLTTPRGSHVILGGWWRRAR